LERHRASFRRWCSTGNPESTPGPVFDSSNDLAPDWLVGRALPPVKRSATGSPGRLRGQPNPNNLLSVPEPCGSEKLRAGFRPPGPGGDRHSLDSVPVTGSAAMKRHMQLHNSEYRPTLFGALHFCIWKPRIIADDPPNQRTQDACVKRQRISRHLAQAEFGHGRTFRSRAEENEWKSANDSTSNFLHEVRHGHADRNFRRQQAQGNNR
jgi:hypothetical protein